MKVNYICRTALVVLLLSIAAHAQSVYPIAGEFRDTQGNVIPGATVIVLSGTLATVNTATQPGSPLATIYSDPAGTMVINQTSNPATTSGTGQFVVYAASGLYVVQAYRNGFQIVSPTAVEVGTGCITSGTNIIPKSDGSSGCTNSSITDNGTTVSTSEAVNLSREFTASNPCAIDGLIYVSSGGCYTTPQDAVSAASLGSTVYVPVGTWLQGATPITDAGVSLKCERGAIIVFNGLGSTTDAVTLQGWSGSTNYPFTVSGCIFDTAGSGSASGRDLIQISGGNGITLRDNWYLDPGRDTIHVEPDANDHWIENLELDGVNSYVCTTAIYGCPGNVNASTSLRDDLNISMGDKSSTSLTGIFVNDTRVIQGNWRAHGRYGYHFNSNNSCSGCSITVTQFDHSHTDGAGHVPASTPGNYVEVGASGASNTINGIECSSCGDEDTVTARMAPVWKGSGTSLGQSVVFPNYVSFSNFSSFMDQNFCSDMNNLVFLPGGSIGNVSCGGGNTVWSNGTPSHSIGTFVGNCPGGSAPSGFTLMGLICTDNSPSLGFVLGTSPPGVVPFGPMEWCKDTTGTQCGSWGMVVPGNANGNDFVGSVENTGTWTKRIAMLQAGGVCFYSVSGNTNACIPDAGGINAPLYQTAANCTSSASPAVCGSAAAGAVTIASGGATTIVVDTTAVTANSDISLTFSSALGTRLSVTCNTTAQQPYVTAISAGASFTISVPAMFITNPGCFTYDITN